MYSYVQIKIQNLIAKASYIVVTYDESTTIDNMFWLCLHVCHRKLEKKTLFFYLAKT